MWCAELDDMEKSNTHIIAFAMHATYVRLLECCVKVTHSPCRSPEGHCEPMQGWPLV